MLVPIYLLENSIRLVNAVGLAYQSPPPLYFNNPILYVYDWPKPVKVFVTRIKKRINLMDLNIIPYLKSSNKNL